MNDMNKKALAVSNERKSKSDNSIAKLQAEKVKLQQELISERTTKDLLVIEHETEKKALEAEHTKKLAAAWTSQRTAQAELSNEQIKSATRERELEALAASEKKKLNSSKLP
jgi:deoxyribodipyrimidine photolyase-like uncharacterized protein